MEKGINEVASARNAALIALPRRAETQRIATSTRVVSPGGAYRRIAAADHHVILGRAGTGKTHALLCLRAAVQAQGDTGIYIDLGRTGGSTASLAPPSVEESRRAAALLLKDLIALLIVELDKPDSAPPRGRSTRARGRALDALESAVSRIDIVGETQGETLMIASDDVARALKASVDFSAQPKGSVGAGYDNKRQRSESRSLKTTGTASPSISFPEVTVALADLVETLPNGRLWLLLDEWDSIPLHAQPFLIDLIEHTVLPVDGVTVKLAAVETRSKLTLGASELTPTRFRKESLDRQLAEVGSGAERGAFVKDVLSVYLPPDEWPAVEPEVADLLSQAAGGIPRDAIEIAALAAELARDEPLSPQHVAEAARKFFHQDKEPRLRHAGAWRLFTWLARRVVRPNGHPVLLLPSESRRDRLLEHVFEARAIHLRETDVLVDDFQQSWDLWELDRAYYWEMLWDDVDARNRVDPPVADIPKLMLPRVETRREISDVPTGTLPGMSLGPAGVSTRVLLATADADRLEPISSRLRAGAYLVILTGDETTGDFVVPIRDTPLHIGRSPAADVVLDDASVSRGHALVVRRDDRTLIFDDRSLNGVFVNGQRVAEQVLRDGDLVMLGHQQMTYLEIPEAVVDEQPAGAAAE